MDKIRLTNIKRRITYERKLLKGRKTQKWSIPILILFRSTFHMRKNSVLTKSIPHHVPEILIRFLSHAKEMHYDVIYSTQTK